MVSKEISDVLYPLMIVIGLLGALFMVDIYFRRIQKKKAMTLDFQILIVSATLIGVVCAVLFQNLYEFIENPETYTFRFGMTFFGGLVGGVLAFFGGYFLFLKKKYPDGFSSISAIAGSAISLAHGFGRVGCVLAGCCYGIPVVEGTSFAWTGIQFVTTSVKVYPTNLFEALFLFLLSAVLLLVAFKTNTKLNLGIYCVSYGLFRFFIEYLRGDDRGSFVPGITPSQFWALLLVALGIFYIVFLLVRKDTKLTIIEASAEPKTND